MEQATNLPSEQEPLPESKSSCADAVKAALVLCVACLLDTVVRPISTFVRETIPVVVDLGVAASGVTLIAGTGAIPNIAMYKAPPLDFTKLAKYTEFQSLFNNFKVDKIETIMIPMWQQTVNPDYDTSGTANLSDLMITRVNTKWLINGLAAESTAELQRGQLAEIQKKTRSLYSGKKWMKMVTHNPDVPATVSDGAGSTNTYVRPSPWLSLINSPDQRYSLNDVFFADRLDGKDFTTGVYLYRMYHRVHFRTSFVG